MTKKYIGITIITIFTFILAACVHESGYKPADGTIPLAFNESGEIGERTIISEEEARERLLEMGWMEDWFIISDEITLQNQYNQSRFLGYAHYIHEGTPIGESGEVIAPRYFGGLKLDHMGFLVVSLLPEGLDDLPTATAVREMLAMGIIFREVEFTQQNLTNSHDRLFALRDYTTAVGISGWGQGAENAITIYLNPYTDEQRVILNEFLLKNGFDLAHFIVAPAISDAMRDFRSNLIAQAAANTANYIVLVGEVEVSRTEVIFSLENTTDMEFNHGSQWDLAQYENGEWVGVTHLPGRGGGAWTDELWTLFAGETREYRQSFEWHFGALLPGRYMFIREGWFGRWDWDTEQERIFAVFEFVVI